MKQTVYFFVVSTLILTPLAHGEQNFDARTMVGYSWGSIEGSQVGFSRFSASTHWKYSDLLAIGPTFQVNHGVSKTDLFDEYLDTELGLDILSGYRLREFFPYWRLNVTLASYVQAEGKINRRISNGTDRADGKIEFPISDGSRMETYETREAKFGYELQGKKQGAELTVGTKWNVSDSLSLDAEAGYAAKTLLIDQAKGSNWGMVGGAEYNYEQRRGLIASGKNMSEGYDLDIERKSRYFGSMTLSLGLNYNL